MYELGPVEVSVSVPDRETVWAGAVVIYIDGPIYHVLLNDILIEELGIVPERPGRGLWKLVDEPTDRLRESAEPEYFPPSGGEDKVS